MRYKCEWLWLMSERIQKLKITVDSEQLRCLEIRQVEFIILSKWIAKQYVEFHKCINVKLSNFQSSCMKYKSFKNKPFTWTHYTRYIEAS